MKHILTLLCAVFILSAAQAQTYPIGHRTITFNDPARTGGFGSGGGTGRQIQTEIYYPATTAGNNTDVATGQFPVVVFGHGFAMGWDAYVPIYDSLAANGFIVALPRTEGSLLPAPSHGDFGKDLALVSDKMLLLNSNSSSPFFQKINGRKAIGGHSMGGGATFLANQYTTGLNCMFTFAAAETNPSAVSAAANIQTPNLVISGSLDCVAPPADHQIPMYNALPNTCKTLISITGGYHCQFNNSNFNCSFGEGTCSPGGGISRADQLNKVRSILIPYLNYYLKGNCAAYLQFNSLMTTSNWLTYQNTCSPTLPAPTLQLSGNTGFCAGSSTSVTVSGANTYTWSNSSTAAQQSISVAGTYSVTGTDANNCTAIISLTVAEYPLPSPSIAQNGLTLSYSGSATVVEWLFNGNVIPGETANSITVNQNGNYQVVVQDANGCSGNSNTISVTTVSVATLLQGKLVMHPNPTISMLYFNGLDVGVVEYQLYDQRGAMLMQGILAGNSLDLSALPAGGYHVKLLFVDGSELTQGVTLR